MLDGVTVRNLELVEGLSDGATSLLKVIDETVTGMGARLLRAWLLRPSVKRGEIEARAWQIQKGWKAPRAAGVIHTDFEKGFIRAEVASYADFVANKGEKGCRAVGKLRTEGKDYLVQDGDVMHFLFAK